MDWYICEKTEDEYLNRTAGIKAREDLDVIFKQCGMKMINLVVGEDTRTRAGVISKIMGHIATKKYWEEKLACVHEGDTIYIQPRTFLFSSIVFLQSYPKMNGIRLSYELYHMQGHSSMINIISQRIP